MSDSACKYCGDPIRWCKVEDHRIALNLVPVAGGQYAVAGADSALYIRKDRRAAYAKLYVRHDRTCRNAAAMRAAAQRRKVGAQIPRNVVKFDRRRVSGITRPARLGRESPPPAP